MTSTEAVTGDGGAAGDDPERPGAAGPRGEDTPLIRLDAYEGPLDHLLDMARSHRVDLSRLSLPALIDQFVRASEAAIAGTPLAQRGGWLVMVAWLVLLRSRLLLPVEAPDRQKAEAEAAALRRQAQAREQTHRAAAWLEARPRLGRDVFRRGAPELPVGRRRSGPTALLEACLTVLSRSEQRLALQPPAPRPRFWTVQQALARMASLAPVLPEGSSLLRYVPDPVALADPRLPDAAVQPAQQRGAVASTLIAGLEMARQGLLSLEQAETNGEIRIFVSETGAAAVAAFQDSGSS
jgi:segregation and condensation protein A